MSLKTRKFYLFPRLTIVLIVVLAVINSVSAQTTALPEPPRPNTKPRVVKPARMPDTTVPPVNVAPPKPPSVGYSDNSEKAIIVDPKINISLLCVQGGNIKVNGWDRNEVRVFINQGSSVGFKVLQNDRQTGKPVWIAVISLDRKNKWASEECISGDDIEIDAPRTATLNIKSQQSRTIINSVGKVSLKNNEGDVVLSNIAQGINAVVYEGDVLVEQSSGAMDLQSIIGNVAVSGVSPSEIGDTFKAKTNNGTISLNSIEYRQMEVNTNSGSIKYEGEILSNGQYSFGTQTGSILMFLPADSSCKVSAVFGFGTFSSELPMKNVEKNPSATTKSLTAVMGSGGAALSFTTYNGSINIKKLTQ